MYSAFKIVMVITTLCTVGMIFVSAVKDRYEERMARQQYIEKNHCHEIDRQYFNSRMYVPKMQCDGGQIAWGN